MMRQSKAPVKDSFEAAQEHAASLNNKFRYKPIQNVQVPLPARFGEEQFAPKRAPALQRQDALRAKEGAAEVLEEL